MTVVGGKLYLLTGDLGRPDSPVTFLSYDPEDDAWATLASPPSAHPQVLAAGTKVVAVSGSDEYGPTSDAAFNPETGTWKRLPDDPLGPSFSRTAAWLGDRLLLTG